MTQHLTIKEKPFIISDNYIFTISVVPILYFRQEISLRMIYFLNFLLSQDI